MPLPGYSVANPKKGPRMPTAFRGTGTSGIISCSNESTINEAPWKSLRTKRPHKSPKSQVGPRSGGVSTFNTPPSAHNFGARPPHDA